MKKRNLLTKGIYLINKKYKKNEFYHFIEEPSNSLIIPILNPCIYIVTTATGTVSKMLSNLIQVSIIKAMAIGIILILLFYRRTFN